MFFKEQDYRRNIYIKSNKESTGSIYKRAGSRDKKRKQS
jgi:hypothetical protein